MYETLNKAQKAKLHYAKQYLGWTDKTYRKFLSRFGVASSVDLYKEEFGLVMAELAKEGFHDQPADLMVVLELQTGGAVPEKKRRMLEYMAVHLCKIDRPTWTYVNAIARKRFGVNHVIQCTHRQLYALNRDLMNYRNRDKQKSAAPRQTARSGHKKSGAGVINFNDYRAKRTA